MAAPGSPTEQARLKRGSRVVPTAAYDGSQINAENVEQTGLNFMCAVDGSMSSRNALKMSFDHLLKGRPTSTVDVLHVGLKIIISFDHLLKGRTTSTVDVLHVGLTIIISFDHLLKGRPTSTVDDNVLHVREIKFNCSREGRRAACIILRGCFICIEAKNIFSKKKFRGK
jgi:hypothetical protein